MEYVPGNIHESLQNEINYALLIDFNVCLCKVRYSDIDIMDDDSFDVLELKKDDIISIRVFRSTAKYDQDVYCYLDYLISNGKITPINRETIVSFEFIEVNTDKVFRVATTQDIREIKLTQLIG